MAEGRTDQEVAREKALEGLLEKRKKEGLVHGATKRQKLEHEISAEGLESDVEIVGEEERMETEPEPQPSTSKQGDRPGEVAEHIVAGKGRSLVNQALFAIQQRERHEFTLQLAAEGINEDVHTMSAAKKLALQDFREETVVSALKTTYFDTLAVVKLA